MKRLVTALLLSFGSLAWAQPEPQPDMTLDTTTRNLLIDRALVLLNEHYVFDSAAPTSSRLQLGGAYGHRNLLLKALSLS